MRTLIGIALAIGVVASAQAQQRVGQPLGTSDDFIGWQSPFCWKGNMKYILYVQNVEKRQLNAQDQDALNNGCHRIGTLAHHRWRSKQKTVGFKPLNDPDLD